MNRSPYQRGEDGLRVVIKEDQVKVAPEDKVKVHVGVINRGTQDDYFNIRVQGIPAEWTTIDMPVVDVVAGGAKEVTLTVQPPAVHQSRVGQYPLDVQAVSQSDPQRSAAARSTLIVAAYESTGRIGVMMGSIHFSASPGSTVNIPILLQNRGLTEDSFRLQVEGIPPGWISANSALTRLEPSETREINITIRVPRSPEATAGRKPFTIRFTSQAVSDQVAEVDCVLTISAYSKFSASLQPAAFEADQFGQVIVNNEGNTADTYSFIFESPGNVLIFEKRIPVSRLGQPAGTQQVEARYVEIPRDERMQIPPGGRGIYEFRTRLRDRPLVGNEKTYPFTVRVVSSQEQSVDLPAQVSERGFIPVWLLSTLLIGSIALCLAVLIPLNNMRNSARATQTAIYNQTQVALAVDEDFDGDGLTNGSELALGTDALKADTDGDGLTDGAEVNTHKTDPKLADTDQDRLPDGEEIQRYQTNALTPDTDADALNDGDEVERRTDPLRPDTDQDALNDGAEVIAGTNPLQQDTDNDGLLDSQENQVCPRPLSPDSDGDGITDGNDPDPCARTSALTPTFIVVSATPGPASPTTAPLPTAVPPTSTTVPPTSVPPTIAPTNTTAPTNPPAATQTTAPPPLQGTLLLASNRDGNSEIYSLNLSNQALTRVTNNPAQEMQPALAPDSVRIVFVTNRDGNNEIYLGGLDGRTPLNITNNAADDQQPVWSPDGNWIAFTSNRDGNQEIYVMRSDGSEVRNLTSNAANDFAPTWFSVGSIFGSEQWIAFTSTRDGNQEVYKVQPDGSDLTNLTQNAANDYSPSGFALGEILTFVTDRDGNPEIYTMNDRGGSLTNITNNSAQDLDPAMNSNGSWIAFSTDREGNIEVYVIRVSGGTAYNLTHNVNQDRHPDW